MKFHNSLDIIKMTKTIKIINFIPKTNNHKGLFQMPTSASTNLLTPPTQVTAQVASPFNVQAYGPAIEKPVFVNEVTFFIVDCKEAGPGEEWGFCMWLWNRSWHLLYCSMWLYSFCYVVLFFC